jgi:hypothetical protein
LSLAAFVAATLAVAAPTPEAPIVVDGKPISRGHLQHWTKIMRRQTGEVRPLEPIHRALATSFLISRRWLIGEAEQRAIVVRRRQVSAELREQRDEMFPRRHEYRAFLRESGQTRRDLRTRVRLSLLSDRIRAEAIAGVEDPAAQQQALEAFVRAYRREWRARTVCRAPWITDDCGQRQARSSRATIRSA